MSTDSQRGLTLIELLISLSIVAILMTIAPAAISAALQKQRISSLLNDFTTALHTARSHAISHGERVTVCKRSLNSDNTLSCSRAISDNWANGWLVFVDDNEDGRYQSAEKLLQIENSRRNAVHLIGNRLVRHYVSYLPRGYARSAPRRGLQMGTFVACADGNPHGRKLVMNMTSRLRTASYDHCPA